MLAGGTGIAPMFQVRTSLTKIDIAFPQQGRFYLIMQCYAYFFTFLVNHVSRFVCLRSPEPY